MATAASPLLAFADHASVANTCEDGGKLPTFYSALLWLMGFRENIDGSCEWFKLGKRVRFVLINGIAVALLLACGLPEGGTFYVHGVRFIRDHIDEPEDGLMPEFHYSFVGYSLLVLYWSSAVPALLAMLWGSASATSGQRSDDNDNDLFGLLCTRLPQKSVTWIVVLHLGCVVLASLFPPVAFLMMNIRNHYPEPFSEMGPLYFAGLGLFCVVTYWVSLVLFTALDVLFLQAHLMHETVSWFSTTRLDSFVHDRVFSKEACERLIGEHYQITETMDRLAKSWKIPLSLSISLFLANVVIAIPTSLVLTNLSALWSLVIVLPILSLMLWFIAFVVESNSECKRSAVRHRGKLACLCNDVTCYDSFLLYVVNTTGAWDLWVTIDYSVFNTFVGALSTLVVLGGPIYYAQWAPYIV